jgi:hypothetical protein
MKGGDQLSKWVEKVKDSHGFIKKGYKCVQINARIAWMYSPTWGKAHVRHNRVDGGGVGFRINSKCL